MIEVVQAASLASTASDQLAVATEVFGSVSIVEWILTTLAIGSLTLSTILFFSVSTGYRRLSKAVADSATLNRSLKQETEELSVMNKELMDKIAGLCRHANAVPEDLTGAISSWKVNPGAESCDEL